MGAGRLIGEKRLVRIDRVGRTAAVASLVDGGPPAADGSEAALPETDGEERPARRRGRRGGRGRRSKADAAADTVADAAE